MAKVWVLCAVLVFSASLAHAAEGKVAASAPPNQVKEPASGMELVYVKGGCYQMGDLYGDGVDADGAGESDGGKGSVEVPVHEACVDDFYLGKYEVTQGQWKKVMGGNPASSSTCHEDDCPVDNVSYAQVQEFIGRLNGKGAGRYRLPTEAEWEYAARSGGKNERYAGGNDLDSVAWYDANSGYKSNAQNLVKAHPVGRKAPNGLGIYDMSGNLWEMTGDWFAGDYYKDSPRRNPTGPASGESHVKRGGCATGFYLNMRVSRRSESNDPNHLVGFRLLMSP